VKKRFSAEQIVAVLKQAEAGVPLAELIWRVGISEQTFHRWKKQYAGLEGDQVRELKQLQEEHTRLRQIRCEDSASWNGCDAARHGPSRRHGTTRIDRQSPVSGRRAHGR